MIYFLYVALQMAAFVLWLFFPWLPAWMIFLPLIAAMMHTIIIALILIGVIILYERR